MYDEFICRFCREAAVTATIAKRFAGMETTFSRLIPAQVRRNIMEECGGLCQYCFEAPAEEIDHIIPYSYMRDHSPNNLLASCRACNASVGSKVFRSMPDKRAFIQKKRLRKIRRRVLPIWVWEDIQELSYNLRGGQKIIVNTHKEAMATFLRLRDLGYNVRM